MGIRVHPADGAVPDGLLRNSDLAMYRAKNDDGKTYRFYASDMERWAHAAVVLDAELRETIDKERFVLLYEPQIALRTG